MLQYNSKRPHGVLHSNVSPLSHTELMIVKLKNLFLKPSQFQVLVILSKRVDQLAWPQMWLIVSERNVFC